MSLVFRVSSFTWLLWQVMVTYQKLRVFDGSQFLSLACFDLLESLFGSVGGNFNEGLLCLNAFDGNEG